MASIKEKGRPAKGSPIPKIIPRQEQPEFREACRELQVVKLTRRCAISVTMAAIIAPLCFGEAER
jgi:hypothetical protein